MQVVEVTPKTIFSGIIRNEMMPGYDDNFVVREAVKDPRFNIYKITKEFRRRCLLKEEGPVSPSMLYLRELKKGLSSQGFINRLDNKFDSLKLRRIFYLISKQSKGQRGRWLDVSGAPNLFLTEDAQGYTCVVNACFDIQGWVLQVVPMADRSKWPVDSRSFHGPML